MRIDLPGASAPRARYVLAIVLAVLSACAAPVGPRLHVPSAPRGARVEPAAAPAPSAPAPAVDGAQPAGRVAPAPLPVAASGPPPPASPAPLSPPASSPPPAPPAGPSIALDAPYKLGMSPAPRGRAEAAERDRWNRGGRGDPPAPPPPREGHPLPRIIVDIDKVKGPLKAGEVQRLARQQLWIHVFSCYRLGAYKSAGLHGKTTVRLTVSRAGRVTGARSTASTLPDADVVSCLVQRARSLSLPGARAGSTVVATLQVFPGDDPVEPPPSALTSGDGALPGEALTAALSQAVPAWRSCYEAALADAPALWGRLAVRFHVTAAGAVDEAFEVESQFPDERVVRCVLRRARTLVFPAPTGGDLRFIAPIRLAPDPSRPL